MNNIKKTVRNLFFESTKIVGSIKKLPDFLIIGAQRSGTTSLYYYLSQHPDTQLIFPKEVHYFDLNYKKGLLWYKNHFPVTGRRKITGEASPYYIFNPYVAKRAHTVLPQAKIIILLRDPAERAFSHYKMNVRNGIEPLSFEEAIDKESDRLQEDLLKMHRDEFYVGENHRRYSYINRGFYDEQLKIWLQYYSLEQMMIIKSEDFFQNTEKVVKQVFEFLEIKSNNVNDIDYRNKNKGLLTELNEVSKIKLKSLFAKHMAKLTQLAGNGFCWSLISSVILEIL